MNTVYIGYDFKVAPLVPGAEILIAQLGAIGFESFVETDAGVTAYISKSDWNANMLDDIQILNSENFSIHYTHQEIAQTNWNSEWEKNFNPIVVDGLCTVRAPFHEKPATQYDIIIEPKMSFGTGHHETTHMMIQYLLNEDLKDKTVLDMGCGTGILAILSEKKHAYAIDAIDYDNWCYLNSQENIVRNHCKRITVMEGDAMILKDKRYDVIIANINRNVLLQDLPAYAAHLNRNGVLFLSGFYQADSTIIKTACEALKLTLTATLERNQWVALKFLNNL